MNVGKNGSSVKRRGCAKMRKMFRNLGEKIAAALWISLAFRAHGKNVTVAFFVAFEITPDPSAHRRRAAINQ